MNKITTLAFALFALLLFSCENMEGMETEEFTVYGNCGMCKKTIQRSLDLDGVSSAEWDMSNDKMTVVFDPKEITLEEIHTKIASVGYDTEVKKAPNQIYNKLHSCCKYDRPE